jgi:hypothetical protein
VNRHSSRENEIITPGVTAGKKESETRNIAKKTTIDPTHHRKNKK